MWVVAFDTLALAFVAPVVNGRKVGPGRVRILERCMATHAKIPFLIERQIL